LDIFRKKPQTLGGSLVRLLDYQLNKKNPKVSSRYVFEWVRNYNAVAASLGGIFYDVLKFQRK
jgi:hypothetical protein